MDEECRSVLPMCAGAAAALWQIGATCSKEAASGLQSVWRQVRRLEELGVAYGNGKLQLAEYRNGVAHRKVSAHSASLLSLSACLKLLCV